MEKNKFKTKFNLKNQCSINSEVYHIIQCDQKVLLGNDCENNLI